METNRQQGRGPSAAKLVLYVLFTLFTLPVAAKPFGEEANRVIKTLLAPPAIKTEPGFKARLLIPPGELYDPLFMVMRQGEVLMNDDGKASNGHGSRILSVASDGSVDVLFDADRILPVVGFDIAPPDFGEFGGQIFALSQPTTGMKGGLANHVIQRMSPATGEVSGFCTLPASGESGEGVAGAGAAAAFGPAGSGFANRLFSITVLNKTIYQTQADGSCNPFADLSSTGAIGFTFTDDGSSMLVSGTPTDLMVAGKQPRGAVVRLTPDGQVDPEPVVTGLKLPMGIAIAPPTFGSYGGELFLVDAGEFEMPVPQTQATAADGKLYRLTREGELKLVASGFVNPSGLLFIAGHLWVTDVNGDFIGGGRELPDGFLVEIDPQI